MQENQRAYHEPTTTLLEEISKSRRRLLSNDTVNSTTSESSSPSILRELEILCKGTEIPRTFILHLSVCHQEGSVNSEDWSIDEGVLKMESSEIVTDTDTICNGEVPVVPET